MMHCNYDHFFDWQRRRKSPFWWIESVCFRLGRKLLPRSQVKMLENRDKRREKYKQYKNTSNCSSKCIQYASQQICPKNIRRTTTSRLPSEFAKVVVWLLLLIMKISTINHNVIHQRSLHTLLRLWVSFLVVLSTNQDNLWLIIEFYVKLFFQELNFKFKTTTS